jgi:hypothetical protein
LRNLYAQENIEPDYLNMLKFANLLFGAATPREKQIVVTFTGGMGAQIISAAIYLSFQNAGRKVYADLSYFNQDEHVATAGNAGEISHWSWALDVFGIQRTAFEELTGYAKKQVELIEDGPKKLALGLEALRLPAVQDCFAIKNSVDDIIPLGVAADYLCIHIRRGDYVNVASHLVSDSEFVALAAKFKGLVKHIVVVSDSPVDAGLRQAISAGYEQASFLDNIDAFASHRVMRAARILICSNSQFSLIAALLNRRALVLLPKQWFGGKDRDLEVPIHEACGFQVLDPVRA